jgi:RimJ/RimL family protein N-acetyltransferase
VARASWTDTYRDIFFVRHQALHGFSAWAVDEHEGDPLVGVAGLLWVEGHGPEVEVAYVLRRDRWGHGYATEATRAILELAHGPLALHGSWRSRGPRTMPRAG